MSNVLKIIILLAIAAVIYTVWRSASNPDDSWQRITLDTDEEVYYLFETGNRTNGFQVVDIPHFKLSWGRTLFQRFTDDFMDTIPADKDVLLSVQLWESHWYHRNGKSVLQDIYDGSRDKDIIDLCISILKPHPNIMLRWNPEMEVPANRYPWENRPFDYIKAFYHIDSLIAEYAPETRVVWGPAGYPGALEFWPENADLASITLGSKSEKRVNAYPDYKDAGIELKRKLHRIRFIDVPVLVLAREDHVPSKKNLYEIESERRIHSDLYALNKSTQTIIHRDSLILGLYDPNALLLKTENLSAEHIFTDFEQISDSTLISKILAINERGHDAIVSFEPMYPSRSVQDRKVLNKTISGEYDSLFSLLFSQLNQLNGRLFLRFAHEMEIPITRYPWQSQDPVLYIDAFRYFMERASEYLPHAVRIWGPAGDRGSEEWYPGDEYVDLISIAIYGLPDKNITDPSQQESFGTIFNRKYRRMRFIRKPVFITEFGVKGPEVYQDNWLDGAADVIRENPQIIGINYFNMIDNPEVWGEGMKAPDWSLTRESWLKFNQSLIDQVGKRD